jgi:hypothetical protein
LLRANLVEDLVLSRERHEGGDELAIVEHIDAGNGADASATPGSQAQARSSPPPSPILTGSSRHMSSSRERRPTYR